MDNMFLWNADTHHQTARGHIPEYSDIGTNIGIKSYNNLSVMSR